MTGRITPYTLFTAALFSTALALGASIAPRYPVHSHLVSSVIWFGIFVALAESLAVSLDSRSQIRVTPTSPVFWSAAAVLGPFPAMVACVGGGFVSQMAGLSAYLVLRLLGVRMDPSQHAVTVGRSDQPSSGIAIQILSRISSNWFHGPFFSAIQATTLYLANIALSVMVPSLLYERLGGLFLLKDMEFVSSIWQFVMPFLGLVACSILIEQAIYVAACLAAQPRRESGGLYGFLLSVKLVLVETAVPIGRAQLFLTSVSLALAYLYAKLGVLGFMLAAMPILALRDFFHQWVQEKTTYLDTITTLATYMQHYHPYTRGHLKRVADMSVRLARELRLPVESIRNMSHAGFLHDIGKIGVSEEILDKTGKLTEEEWEHIKAHPVKGAEIISHLEFLEDITDWIKYHHKWYDGSGYPYNGVAPGDVPLEAAIIAVADSFDAMTDDRELALVWKCDSCGYEPGGDQRPETCPECGAPKRRTYREPKTLDEAIEELRRGAGTQFHPRVVKAFLAMVEREGVRVDAQ